MALIKCPECEQFISDKASKCPKCGYPIQEYLSNQNETQNETAGENFAATDESTEIQQIPTPKKSKKKLIISLVVVCFVAAAALGVALGLGLFTSELAVEDITISKWRLTDSTDYGDYYEGTISSEQKSPFIAVIGQYEDEDSAPEFVYMEDGEGVIETYEDTDEDPSIKYKPIGYMSGLPVDISDMQIKYEDSDYYDWSYDETSNCSVLIDIDMNNSKTGLLVFDIINETNNETERNYVATVIDGKAEYSYWADLPYKARGIDVSIVPKLFCECATITQENYVVEKAYAAEKDEGTYYSSYSGEETLSFADYADGYVLYTKELKEGGNKENRDVLKNARALLLDGECVLTTYDSVGEDETILMPKYEFNVVGYVTWTTIEKEIS